MVPTRVQWDGVKANAVYATLMRSVLLELLGGQYIVEGMLLFWTTKEQEVFYLHHSNDRIDIHTAL